jgi:hypothetical protein
MEKLMKLGFKKNSILKDEIKNIYKNDPKKYQGY